MLDQTGAVAETGKMREAYNRNTGQAAPTSSLAAAANRRL
jgi:hypothetical protein